MGLSVLRVMCVWQVLGGTGTNGTQDATEVGVSVALALATRPP